MMLTVREAAVLLGKPARTVRAMLARGELRGVRRATGWVIAREALPITDARLEEVGSRLATLRAVVEQALPSKLGDKKAKSVVDMPAFGVVREVLGGLVPGDPACAPLLRALHALARAVHRYNAPDKRAALAEARDALCDAIVLLVVGAPAGDAALAGRLRRIEGETLRPIGGLLRWSERELPARRSA